MPTVTVPPPSSTPARPTARAATHRTLSRRAKGLRRVVIATLFFAVLVYAWHLISASLSPGRQLMFPPPENVWKYLLQAVQPSRLPSAHTPWDYWRALLTNSDIFVAMRVTMTRLFIGYLIGVLAGVPLGVLTARYRSAEDTIGVVGLGLQTLPSVCWVPLALLWFGQSESAMLFVVIMGTVWSVQIAVDNGMRSVPPIYARAARTMGSSGFHTWWYVMLPASLPFIVSGVKQGWAFAWRSLMAAEIYVVIRSGAGLGQLLHYGREFQAMDQVIGIMFVIVMIGLLADKILFSPWERFLHKRWGTVRA